MSKTSTAPRWFKRAALILLPLWLPGTPMAQVVWSGASGTNDNLSTDANWVGGVAPVSSTSTFLQFGGAGTSFTPNVDIPFTLNRLDIDAAAAYTIGGSTLTFGGTNAQLGSTGGSHSITAPLVLNANLAVSSGSFLTLSAVSGAGTMTKLGTGTLTLVDMPRNSGGIVISAGTLQAGTGAPIIAPSNFGGDVVNNAALVIDNGAGGLFVGIGSLSGTGSLTKNGGGGLISLGPVWTHGGSTTLNDGSIGASILSTGRLTVNGGTFDTGLSTFGSLAGAGGTININGGGTLTVGGDNTSTSFAGQIGNTSGTLVKNGTGTLILANAPQNSGGTVINAGTLQVGTGAPIATPSNFGGDVVNNGALVIDNGAGGLFFGIGSLSGTGSLTKNGGGGLISLGPVWTHGGSTTLNDGSIGASILSTGRLTVNGGTFDTGLSTFGSLAGAGGTININGGGTLTVGGDNTSTSFAGQIGNTSGTLVKNGTGTLILANAPQNSGGTVINAGTLQVGTGAPIATPSNFSGDVVNNGALVIDNGAGGLFFGIGSLSGTGSLTKNGGGGLISLGPVWTHGGSTTLNDGSIGASILSTGRLTVNGGTFDTGLSTFGSLAGTGGTININGGGTLTVGGDNASTSFAGQIGSTGNLVKQGTGNLTLSGTNTLSGTTTVSDGRLSVNGSLASSVIVNAGGTLGGTGTVGNALTVDLGGVVAPGNSIGTLTVDATTRQSEFNGTLEIEIDGALIDVLAVTGAHGLRFGDSASIRFILRNTPEIGRDYEFLVTDLLDGFDGDVDLDFQGLGSGLRYVVFERDEDLHLRFQTGTVPLPGTLSLIALVLAGLLVQRRRPAQPRA